ncbi:MAG TPA: M56 family metallopeptidase, partial [Planctomycetaceae bacterium]|nr:M56 family metallopeptidase [Planctomycetaceae bacterium]
LSLLWTQTWQIAVLAILVAVVARFVAKNRPHLAHAMWILVLVKCVTPPLWGHSLGVFSQLQTLVEYDIKDTPVTSETTEALSAAPIVEPEPLVVDVYEHVEPVNEPLPEFVESKWPQHEITLAEEPPVDASAEFVAASFPIELAASTVSEIEIAPSPWARRLLIALTMGAILTLLITVVRCVRCLRLIHRHRITEFDGALNERLQQIAKTLRMRRIPRIIVSDVLFGPAVLGLLRHTIVLPSCLLEKSTAPNLLVPNLLVPRLQPRNTLYRRLLPPVPTLEAGASGQCVPGQEPWNEAADSVASLSGTSRLSAFRPPLSSLDPILAHELLHIRRGDLRFGMLQLIAQCLWWFHPAVWFANRWLSREAERCCDEQVIAELGCSPAQYARSLLAVIERKHTLQPIPVFPGMKPVEITTQRMERIMSLKTGLNKRTPLWCWQTVAALAIVVLPGAVAKTLPEEAASEPPAQTPSVEGTSANTKAAETSTNTFEGNEFWTDKDLAELVTELAEYARGRDMASEDIQKFEIETIKAEYRESGFFDVEVRIDSNVSAASSTIARHFTIVEGERYKIREIRFEGNKRIATADLEAALNMKPGDNWNSTAALKDVERIRYLYTLLTPAVSVNPVPHFTDDPGAFDLVFQIDDTPTTEGTPVTLQRESLRTESYNVKELIERLAADEDVILATARERLVTFLNGAVPAVIEKRTAALLEQGMILGESERKQLSSITLDRDRLVVVHSNIGHQQVEACLHQFRRCGFRQVIVSAYFLTGPTDELNKLVAETTVMSELVAGIATANHGDKRLPIGQNVITSNAFSRILHLAQQSDLIQLESHSRIACLNGQTGEVYSGVLRPFIIGNLNREHWCNVAKCGTTLGFCPTIIDTDLLRLSCTVQTRYLKDVLVLAGTEMPSFTTNAFHSDIELNRNQAVVINGMLTDVANDKVTKSLLVLLKATTRDTTSLTDSIRLADDFIPNSDMELGADSVVAFVGEKPITVADVFGAQRVIQILDQNVSIENGQQILMKSVISRLPDYLYSEAVLKHFADNVSDSQQTAIKESLAPYFEEALEKIRQDKRVANNEDLIRLLLGEGYSVAQSRNSFVRMQIIEGYLQAVPVGSPLLDKESILEHCRTLLESASRNASNGGVSRDSDVQTKVVNTASRDDAKSKASKYTRLVGRDNVKVGAPDDEAEAEPNAAVAPRLVLCTYPVADLLIPVPPTFNAVAAQPGIKDSATERATAENPSGDLETLRANSAQAEKLPVQLSKAVFAPLVELIKASVDSESWGNKGVIAEEMNTLSLVVRQTDQAHGEIGELLSKLRKGRDQNVQITSLLVKLTTEEQLKIIVEHNTLHSLGEGMKWSLLTPKRSETFTKALLDQKPNVISSPRIMTISGQAATVMIGSMDKSVFSGFRMTVTPQLVPDSPIIRLQHQISIGTDRQTGESSDAKSRVDGSIALLVGQDLNNAGSVMHESLVGSGQTLLLLIERPGADNGTKSVDRYVLLLTPEHIHVEEVEERVPKSDQR